MSIKLFREPVNYGPPLENCCFCFSPSPYWSGDDEDAVPVCPKCAAKHNPGDLPTKIAWYIMDCSRDAVTRETEQ